MPVGYYARRVRTTAIMNFTSPFFLFLFLPLSLLAYWAADSRRKVYVGVAASLLFYAWGASLPYLLLMAALIIFNYLWARLMSARRADERLSLALTLAGVAVNLVPLIYFKWESNVAYPLGLSYIAFQTISYLLEVYKNRIAAESDFFAFAFYVLLFPKVLVGPITRYSALKEQIANPQVTPQSTADGIRRFIRGFAKKALIADTLAKVVTPVFALEAPNMAPAFAWLALIAYTLQLYFDFSGYTDMALGLGQMLGLKFIENFNFPYISKSISEFWRRWHISLSSWFRDFVFFPLERRRLKFIGQPLNILIVFLLTGLWHGFSRGFILWGLLHGLAIVFENTWPGRKLRSAWAPVQHLYALTVILAGWVFFRSPTPEFAIAFFQRLAGNIEGVVPMSFWTTQPLPIIEPTVWLALALGILFALPVASFAAKQISRLTGKFPAATLPLQLLYDGVMFFLLVASIAATASGNFAPNIYGNF